ncbi:MAG TPA: hypothetical protein VGY55_14770 [Pirellulales bacterium]|nr:hypothetical protein [Pirellulales bacterium]
MKWIVAAVLVIGLPLGYYNFILDWQGKPYCHAQIMLAFENWIVRNGKDSTTRTNEFPNVGGVGRNSLNAIREEMEGSMDWAPDYGYVPGLQQNDPGQLVLMYFNRPTRWTMHISAPTIFEDKAWILIPVDFGQGRREKSGPGEDSERVSTEEFKKRLKETIEYIRKMERPNWQTIVAEQTKFLERIDGLDR